MLSASPRRFAYGHGRASYTNNFPPFADPVKAQEVATVRMGEARPWLAGTPGATGPSLARSPRRLAPVSVDRIPVPVPRRKQVELPQPVETSLGHRWNERLTAVKPGKKAVSVQRHFELMDKDRSGNLTHEEVLKSILSLHLKVKPGEIDEIIRSCDTNGDGVVDFDEFRIGIMKLQQKDGAGWHGGTNRPKQAMFAKHALGEESGTPATIAEIDKYMNSIRDAVEAKYTLLRKAFMAMDKDRSNYLSKSEIVDVVQSFALPIPVSHIHQVFDDVFDKNGDGKISYTEFCDKIKAFDT